MNEITPLHLSEVTVGELIRHINCEAVRLGRLQDFGEEWDRYFDWYRAIEEALKDYEKDA